MDGLTNSFTTQAQIQGFKLTHPNIYPILEILEHVKQPILQNQSYRISMTQGNDRISKSCSGGAPVSTV